MLPGSTLPLVILETDQALLALTKTRVLGNAAVTVTFDPPARPWIQALKTPAVNFFLFDVRENTHRRDVMYEQVRDEGGKVVGHRPPALRYDLHYTVTVWGAPIATEHQILALVLRCFGALPTLPKAVLPPALAKSGHEVHLTTAAGTKRGMFLNLAGEVKLGFELTATVAMPVPDVPAAGAVTQAQVSVAPKQAAPGTATNGTGAPENVQHAAPAAGAVAAANPAPAQAPAAAATPVSVPAKADADAKTDTKTDAKTDTGTAASTTTNTTTSGEGTTTPAAANQPPAGNAEERGSKHERPE
jgi:hypothetical protein